MHANAVESLIPFLYPGARVLDIGSGSGYLVAVFGELLFSSDLAAALQEVGNRGGKGRQETPGKTRGGVVVGLEHIPALRDQGEGNMRKSERGRELLADGRVQFVVGDGRKGWRGVEGRREDEGDSELWDVIHVGAAAVEVHEELVKQLKRPGR
jgi:protein-L-isoaspartate(D-aspartate) O-methyltransferase